MERVYNLCMLLIQRGRTDSLLDKMDVYLMNDRLTVKEYNDLVEFMTDVAAARAEQAAQTAAE